MFLCVCVLVCMGERVTLCVCMCVRAELLSSFPGTRSEAPVLAALGPGFVYTPRSRVRPCGLEFFLQKLLVGAGACD